MSLASCEHGYVAESCGYCHAASVGYYRGVAAAMDVIRAYDFPVTERVDVIAESLAPASTEQEVGDAGMLCGENVCGLCLALGRIDEALATTKQEVRDR